MHFFGSCNIFSGFFSSFFDEVEGLELLLGELGDAGFGHEAVLVLGRDQLDVLQVGGFLNLEENMKITTI